MNATTETVKAGRTLTGRVVSNKMQKTITVVVERVVTHPEYGKILHRRTKIKAHDEENACQEGDTVEITPCRPMSRDKAWKLVRILTRAPRAAAASQTDVQP
ncbi:MAG: 30S ribosomal protein S17 [Gammaproteobacteria bacterium]|nr:30S ribosomal protein S17 [Gammaproteobacteria bacterium]MBU6509729.1 30S ribosomal protein S17 [Gammaproteobacteria bacterium]MDE1983544.1 30S ribosomal protein S17 [Gammaproteobacteria bacterium]MDE2107653.1 30S ribosomal protein S17 [Gammaproteobacteria bacterium]MDE2460101.1 30S ribosomal protein S17 [Gammaproteobacteria bacterium]